MKTFLYRAGLVLVALGVTIFVASYLIDPMIRARVEREMNEKLTDYHTQVKGAHLQLLNGALTLRDVIVIQNKHPKPPVADVPMLRMSMQWRELFSWRIVADCLIAEPHFHINLTQLRTEASIGKPMRQEGWQDAIQNIYPFKINHFRVYRGDIVYIDADPKKPLHVERLNFEADNIRNIHAPDNTYPSMLRADAIVFDTGHAALDGSANFLEEPFPGLRAKLTLRDIPLQRFEPAIRRVNFDIKGGVLNGNGLLEYSPRIERAEIYNATADGITAQYIHTLGTAEAEQNRLEKTEQAAKQAANEPGLMLKIDEMRMTNCNLGFASNDPAPGYQLSIEQMNARITNLSNHFDQGASDIDLHGMFMGSGKTSLTGVFRPEKEGPDFNLKLAIENTDLTSLNDLLRSYGRFDVAAGQLSVFSEDSVQKGMMQGWVKPLFANLEVYNREKERGRPLTQKAKEAAIGIAAKILKNRGTQQVATQVDISGKLDNPQTSNWQALLQLLRNGFIKAILPGFDRQTRPTPAGTFPNPK